MNPRDFVLWLNGAAAVVGTGVPSPAQWAAMRGQLDEVVGEMVAEKLRYPPELGQMRDAMRETAKQQIAQSMAQKMDQLYIQQMADQYQERTNDYAKTALEFAAGAKLFPASVNDTIEENLKSAKMAADVRTIVSGG